MGSVLITGAAGYLGRAITAQALAMGWSVRGLVRRPDDARPLLPPEVDLVAGDVRDEASLRDAMQGMDAVIHLVAISYERGSETFEAVHVGGTRAVLEAMAGAGVRTIVYMSALGTRLNARSRFHQSRWAAEQAVRDSGLDWTILRPSLVLGPGDYFVSLHLRMLRLLPVLPVIGNGRQLLQPIARDDLADVTVQALSGTSNATYDAVGPQRLTLLELQTLLMKLVDKQRPRVHLPIMLASLSVPLLQRIGTPPMLTHDQLLLLQEPNIGDPGPLQHDFGRKLMPPQQALAYLREIKLNTARGVRIG